MDAQVQIGKPSYNFVNLYFQGRMTRHEKREDPIPKRLKQHILSRDRSLHHRLWSLDMEQHEKSEKHVPIREFRLTGVIT